MSDYTPTTERMNMEADRILRAALDQEGGDDE